MVTPRPLKLKREVVRAGVLPNATELPVARVWVDTGVFHLEEAFEYLVPQKFSDDAQVGIRVEVEFGSTIREGLIVERVAQNTVGSPLKQIIKILSPHAVATEETISLIAHVCERWAGVPFDVLRDAIPPRVASVDKEEFPLHAERVRKIPQAKKPSRAFLSLPPARAMGAAISEFISKEWSTGQLLIICSTERELREVHDCLAVAFPSEKIVRLDGAITRAERYRNYLLFSKGLAGIGIGLRGAVFTPVSRNSLVVLISESSEHLYEQRSPGWNARDITFLRSALFSTSILLAGFTPSLETGRLIENSWLAYLHSRSSRKVIAQEQSQGSLLPVKSFPVIRKALNDGPVLFLAPRKGYGNAVLCAKCRNAGQCSCGGRLKVSMANDPPECAVCGTRYPSWECEYCKSTDIYLADRGIERFAEEIGRAFPNFQVINSSGEHIIHSLDIERGLVIATPGAEPRYAPGYSAVILLEGLRFFGASDIRATERAREQFFVASHLSAPDRVTFAAIDPVHPIIAALSRWDSSIMVKRELRDQENAQLPPYFRFITLEVASKEVQMLYEGILQAQNDGRIPESTNIRRPFERDSSLSRIVLTVPVNEAASLVIFVKELQKRRSLSRKNLMRIRIDPYSLA